MCIRDRSTNIRENYNGIARLFRARFYFDKLVQYGEVPWIDKVFNEAEDPDLYNLRDTRDVIIGAYLGGFGLCVYEYIGRGCHA